MVEVDTDGRAWGEVITSEGRLELPGDFRIPDHQRLFEIPAELVGHELTTALMAGPLRGKIILAFRDHDVVHSVFLMAQLPIGCALRYALDDLLSLIQPFTERGASGNRRSAK
jgi:hypothetical protein